MSTRQLTGFEVNHLLKHGKFPIDMKKLGEKPVEYVTGMAEFMGREFFVNKHTLIPRIETEQLVEMAVKQILKSVRTGRERQMIVDVGTGSGCVGVSIWLELFEREVDVEMVLLDVSEEALKIAKKNVNKFKAERKIRVVKSNLLLDCPPSVNPSFVVANLPYIPSDNIDKLDESVVGFEPRRALDGGFDGLELVRELLDQTSYMTQKPEGILLEVDEHVEKGKLPVMKGFELRLVKDEFAKQRFVVYEAST